MANNSGTGDTVMRTSLHRRIVVAYRLRTARLCQLLALGGFAAAKTII